MKSHKSIFARIAAVSVCVLAASCMAPYGELAEDDDEALEEEDPSDIASVSQALNMDSYSKLCITTSGSESGTNNAVTLEAHRANTGTYYKCSFPSGVSSNATSCCTPSTATGGVSTYSKDIWTIRLNSSSSSDGFKITKVEFTGKSGIANVTQRVDTFQKVPPYGVQCDGDWECDLFQHNCDTCWIDGSGNGNCWRMNMDSSGQVWSNNTGWY